MRFSAIQIRLVLWAAIAYGLQEPVFGWFSGVCQSASDAARCITVLPIFVNGLPAPSLSRDGVILYREAGTYYLKRQQVQALGLRLVAEQTFHEEGEEYVSLAAVPMLRAVFDEEKHELHLLVGPDGLGRGATPLRSRPANLNLTESGNGFFINFDSNLEMLHGTRFYALAELNAFGRWGSLVSTVRRADGVAQSIARLNTTYIYDLPERRESLRVGDSLTQGGAWGRSLYFGGIQWGTAFETQPDLVRFPLPTLRGEAMAPSTAELYVNQSLRWTSQVPAGAFEIVQPPLISGPGQYRLVVRDALGRQTVTEDSYFASPRLLAAGLSDYSISAGFVRNYFGERSNSYGRALATAHYRHGLNGRLTVESRTEVAGDLLAGGVNATVALFGPLLASGTWIESTGGGYGGRSFAASLDAQFRRISLGAQTQHSTEGFRQLGLNHGLRPDRKFESAYVSMFVWRRDHLSLTYFRQDRVSQYRFLNAGYSLNIKGGVSIIATYARILTGFRGSTLTLGLNVQVGHRGFASLSGQQDRDGRSIRGSLQRNLPLGEGIGYRLSGQTGADERVSANGIARLSKAELEANFDHSRSGTGVQVGARGAVGMLGKDWFVSRRIDDGFALLRVANYADVPVLVENQPIAVTDRRGLALIPRLLSFQPNHVSINTEGLPLDAEVGSAEITVRPGRRRGVAVAFPVKRTSGFSITLVDGEGKPVPVSSEVTIKPGDLVLQVGFNGLLYVQGTTESTLGFLVRWPEHTCKGLLTGAERLNAQSAPEVVVCK